MGNVSTFATEPAEHLGVVLDGGDILKVVAAGTKTAYVGVGGRTNPQAVAQLALLLAPRGWFVRPVPVHKVLHLKSAVTALPDGTMRTVSFADSTLRENVLLKLNMAITVKGDPANERMSEASRSTALPGSPFRSIEYDLPTVRPARRAEHARREACVLGEGHGFGPHHHAHRLAGFQPAFTLLASESAGLFSSLDLAEIRRELEGADAPRELILGIRPDHDGLRDDLAAKRDLLCAGLATAGFDVFRPSGTYFVTADVRPLGFDDGLDFCRTLPERCGVVAVPNAAFYADPARGRHLVRFAFCKRTEVLAEAADRLATLRPG